MTRLEQISGGIIGAIIVALLSYGGMALIDARQSVATLDVRVTTVERDTRSASLIPERLAAIETQLQAVLQDLAIIKADAKQRGRR